ncbi:Desmin [Merluccius polli]|uniref:Desmin n=1 Tax=Merluccius polli TaxID=89951 RepID=A0AA47NC86_MERPO|nr:Desmin [Merluccius polli]
MLCIVKKQYSSFTTLDTRASAAQPAPTTPPENPPRQPQTAHQSAHHQSAMDKDTNPQPIDDTNKAEVAKKVLDKRTDENAQLYDLNHRLANYIEKVRSLVQVNTTLGEEVDGLKGREGSDSEVQRLKDRNDNLSSEVETANHKCDTVTQERDNLNEYLQNVKKRLQEEKNKNKDLRAEADKAKLANKKLEGGKKGLQEELDFLKRTHKENESLIVLGRNASGLQNTIRRLEYDSDKMKDKMAHQLKEYQDLLDIKMTLEKEITKYRELLDGMESR